MSTFNKVYCETIYEKGSLINAESLRGDPGATTSTGGTKGDTGANGKLQIANIITTPETVIVTVPNPLEVDKSVFHISKNVNSYIDIPVMTHLNIQIATLYKIHDQELTLYKRGGEWVF